MLLVVGPLNELGLGLGLDSSFFVAKISQISLK